MVAIGGLAVGASTAYATPSNTPKGHEPTPICHREGNGSSHTIIVDNSSVLAAHLRHGDSLGACPASTPTATPSATPTGTATPTVTPTPPASFEDGDNDPCKNHPFLNQHNQVRTVNPNVWLQDTDCGQFIIPTPTPAATPVVTPTATPSPVPATGGPVPLLAPRVEPPTFDLSTIKALPKAGDGSLSD